MKFCNAMVAALAAFALAPAAPAATIVGAEALNEWNLIVLGDLQSSSNVQGRTFVGGNITGANSADFNQREIASTRGQAGLTVVGNVAGNTKNVHLGANIGGSVATGFNLNGPGQTLRVGKTVGSQNVNAPNVVQTRVAVQNTTYYDASFMPDLTAQKNALQSSMLALSGSLAGLAATPGASFVRSGNVGTFTAAGDFNVINIDGARLAEIGNISFSNSGTTIVNVSGLNITLDDNFNGPSGLGQKVIWNFYQADTLTFNNSFYGSVLAPSASATMSNFIEGTVVLKNLVQNGEVHLGTFDGNLTPPAVPEPATWAMMIAGFGLVGTSLRRRHATPAIAA